MYTHTYTPSIFFFKAATLTEVQGFFPQLPVSLEAQVDFAELQMGGDGLLKLLASHVVTAQSHTMSHLA